MPHHTPTTTPTPRTLRAAALFGIQPRRHPPAMRALAAKLSLRPGQVALITGPSGSGKSTLARALARRFRAPLITPHSFPRRGARAVIDLFRSPFDTALRHLARAGLAEAPLLLLRPDQLSDGQRARLAIALAIESCHRLSAPPKAGAPACNPPPVAGPPTLILDEFASTLDRSAATSLARSLRRLATTAGLCIYCLTAHDDILEPLNPDLLVYQPLTGPAKILCHRSSVPPMIGAPSRAHHPGSTLRSDP